MEKLKTFNLMISFTNDSFIDAMDAQSEAQAIQLAYWNWELAEEITILGVDTL